jgi:PAS domain-containing protein
VVEISSRFADDGRRQGAVTLSLARSRPQLGAAGSVRVLTRARGQGPATGAAAVTQGLLWKMIDAFDDGVALADGEGTLVLANRRLEEMFGYPYTELDDYPVERLGTAPRTAASPASRRSPSPNSSTGSSPPCTRSTSACRPPPGCPATRPPSA